MHRGDSVKEDVLNLESVKSTIEKAEKYKKELKELIDDNFSTTTKDNPWVVGEQYFIRTVTMAVTGKLVSVGDKELVLEDAAWIADTGRFSDFLSTGKLSSAVEVEPFPNKIILGRGSVIDATVWDHALPSEKK